jgi:hypothetical protein
MESNNHMLSYFLLKPPKKMIENYKQCVEQLEIMCMH